MSNDPLIGILNNIIKQHLGDITSKVDEGIRSAGLDPMHHVAGGSHTLGRVNLGVGHASVDAHYDLGDLRGLSSMKIEQFEITGGGSDPNNPSAFGGTILLHAAFGSDLKIHAGGGIEAKVLFIHKSVGIGGTVTVSDASATASGSFNAAIKDGQICLEKVQLGGLSVNYAHMGVDIDGLGFFNEFLHPLENLILGAAKGAIRGVVSSALHSPVNNAINGQLPLCGKVA